GASGIGNAPPASDSRLVEVPGGSVKQFLLLVQAPATSGEATVKVELKQGSSVVGSKSQSLQPVADTELVGLSTALQGGRPLPGPAPLSIDVGSARFVAVGDLELAGAPASLDSLTAVAITADDLTRVGEE